MKKQYIILMAAIMLITLIIVSAILMPRKKPGDSPSVTPTPTTSSFTPFPSTEPTVFNPPKMDELPYLPEELGGGIDRKSIQVQDSIRQIELLNKSLPYQTEITLNDGGQVVVLIPESTSQINAWTLTVQIFGIDYQVPEGDPEYQIMRTRFLEAADRVFGWMRSKGANPDKVIISWGDKVFIQQSAEKWLDSQ